MSSVYQRDVLPQKDATFRTRHTLFWKVESGSSAPLASVAFSSKKLAGSSSRFQLSESAFEPPTAAVSTRCFKPAKEKRRADFGGDGVITVESDGRLCGAAILEGISHDALRVGRKKRGVRGRMSLVGMRTYEQQS